MSMDGLRQDSILQGNMGLGDDLGKFRKVGLEPPLEFRRRAGDRLVAGDVQPLENIGRGQRGLGAMLDRIHDVVRRIGRYEPSFASLTIRNLRARCRRWWAHRAAPPNVWRRR